MGAGRIWSRSRRATVTRSPASASSPTATTGQLLRQKVGLSVETVLSGPMGGDAQIAAMVAEGRVTAVLFFVDPLSAHPHDPDIRTLLRVCNVHDVPIATNVAPRTSSSCPRLDAAAPVRSAPVMRGAGE